MSRSPTAARHGRVAQALTILVLSTACTSPPAASPIGSSAPASAAVESASGTAAPTAEQDFFGVTVNGVEISGACYGTATPGVPTVVYAHGIGGDYPDMELFRDHFQGRAMVCGYSRAGVGRSDPPSETPRPIEEVVTEMHDVLGAAEIAPPYFLVGFSGGGSLVMMYAQAHPADVVGFVSINPAPSYEQWIEVARDVWSPEEFQTMELDWYAGMNPEQIDMRGTSSLLTNRLPDTLPYAVMFDEDCGGDTTFCNRLLPPLATSTELLAKVGEGGRFVWVKGAGHEIDVTEPQRVRETVDEIWGEATGDPITSSARRHLVCLQATDEGQADPTVNAISQLR